MNDLVVQQESQITTDQQSFKPSANQEKWLDTAMQSDSEEVTRIAEECGIDRSQWYRWLKEPGFIDWYKAEWEKRFAITSTRLDVIGVRMAKRDTRALELMMKRVGTLKEDKNTNIQVNVTPILGGATKEK